VAWFDVGFNNLKNPVLLSTSPFKTSTHWKQVVFYLKDSLNVEEGDELSGSIAVRKSRSNFRELDIKISYYIDSYYNKKEFT
jgi:hypothetical protein